ncbi:hypothetical protein [Pseudopedobacter beijingensis]|uniref:Uncharacterized protein n=1 Tax=Pseudopedobacter beijingensis TaxID=1207056 RepID=A0ABW4IHV8_9SPHI
MINKMLLFIGIGIFCSCSPKVSTNSVTKYEALSYDEQVFILNVNEEAPHEAEILGTIKIGDSGFTTKCDYDLVMEQAKLEARKIGGNVVKLTKFQPPSMSSTCYRISANILRVDYNVLSAKYDKSEEVLNVDYAILNIYRHKGMGAWVGYDLYLGDSVICRVKNNFKITLHIKKDGLNTLWTKTEAKTEVPVDLVYGKQYYLRCGINMGAFVGRPTLELVDYRTGKSEFELIKPKNNE